VGRHEVSPHHPAEGGGAACPAAPSTATVDTVARTDYVDDPDAPTVNSVVPSAVAVVERDGDVLLIHKTDNDLWALPGGGHEPGETISQTVVREVREETGYEVEVTGLVGTYTDPGHVIAYDDGEVRQQFSLCFTARLLGGTARTSSESKAVAWVVPRDTADLPMHPSMRLRLQHALEHRPTPYLG